MGRYGGKHHALLLANHGPVVAKSYLSFTNKRGGVGCSIQIPMMHKHDEGARSHYLTFEMHIPDAPAPDEIVIALGAATGGRAHPRIGNMSLKIFLALRSSDSTGTAMLQQALACEGRDEPSRRSLE